MDMGGPIRMRRKAEQPDSMARFSRNSQWLAVCLASLLAAPAAAQFGPVFNEPPPRPPADVPNAPSRDTSPPPYYPSQPPPPYTNQSPPYYANQPPYYSEQQQPAYQPPAPRPPVDIHSDLPPAKPLPAPMSLPPQSRPGRGTIQSRPLPAPPGTQAPVQAKLPTPQQPTGPAAAPVRTPGQRGAMQQPADTTPQQGDEIVVEPPPQRIANPTAVFSGLDKITGRITSFDVAINETVQFGALQVTPRVCYSRPPTETPQTDAFVEVDEVTLQGKIQRIFTGWMFAASPGLHAVEHPIYDVWLTDCKGGKNPAVADVSAGAQASVKPVKPAPKRTAPRAPQRGTVR
jgi:hypothetical protein